MPRSAVLLAFVVAVLLLVAGCRADRDERGRRTGDPRPAAVLRDILSGDGAAGEAAESTAAATAVPLPTVTPLPTPTEPPTSTPDPFAAAGLPVRLEIPSIGVDAFVETVGLTGDRAMDVPKGWMNVGWYEPGFRPGETGNSVIAGHLDTNSGGPAVFWALDRLQPGDEVAVTYANGDRYTFVVESSETYEQDSEGAIIERIFGESLTADLNLITCDGAWDHGEATYTHRLVVFTTLVPDRAVRAGGEPTT